MHSLGIVQWNSTGRDHLRNPEGVSGSGPVNLEVGTKIEYQLVKLDKVEVGLVKLDVFRNCWTVQFREISSRVKSPNFGFRAYKAHCVIGPVGVQLGWFHSFKIYSKAFGVSQCCWFSYWSLNGVLFILQAHAGPGDDLAGEQD